MIFASVQNITIFSGNFKNLHFIWKIELVIFFRFISYGVGIRIGRGYQYQGFLSQGLKSRSSESRNYSNDFCPSLMSLAWDCLRRESQGHCRNFFILIHGVISSITCPPLTTKIQFWLENQEWVFLFWPQNVSKSVYPLMCTY